MKFIYALTALACGFVYQADNWLTLKNKFLAVGMGLCFSLYLVSVHWSVALFSVYWLSSSFMVWPGAIVFDVKLGLDFIARYSMAQASLWFVLTSFVLSRFSRDDFDFVIKILWGFSVLNSAFSLLQWCHGITLNGFLGEPSMSAAFNGLMGLYALWYLVGWYRVFFILNTFSVLVSHSTTSVVIFAFGISLYLFFMLKNPLRLVVVLAVLFAFAAFALWYDPGFIRPGDRLIVQKKFMEFFIVGNSLFLGWGNGSFIPMGLILSRKLGIDEPWIWFHLHSGLLRLLWEGGTMGVVLALNVLVFALKHAWHDKRVVGLMLPAVLFFVVQYPEFLPFQGMVCAVLLMQAFVKTHRTYGDLWVHGKTF